MYLCSKREGIRCKECINVWLQVSATATNNLSASPSSCQTASVQTESRLRALDLNQDKTHVVVAGGKILKIFRIEGTSCIEHADIRAAVVDYRPPAPPGAGRDMLSVEDMSSLAQRETFDIEDVAWSNGSYKSYIATASSNGKVVLYDLERPGVRVRQLSEHQRQVHKVDFNKKEGAFLLSGSQDGDVKMWDLRVPRLNVQTYSGRSDGIRHVKWSPESTWSFCFGTDNGSLQRWDTRNTRQAAIKIAAHTGTINSVDWHLDGIHLVSAGKDQNVKVWNLQADSSRYTVDPLWEFRTPYEIQNVRWRPPCLSTDSASSGDLSWIKQCTHLATSYKHKPLVHIWDLRRPHLPFRAIHHMTNKGTTDMMWRSKDLLLTVGPEGELTQSDVKFATNVEDARPTSVLRISARNELTAFVASRRPCARLSIDSDTNVGEPGGSQSQPESSKAAETTAEKRVHARSPGDDSFDDGFLPPSAQRKFRATSHQSLSTLAPTADAMRGPTTQLNEVMRNYATPSSNQLGFTISLSGYGLGFKHFKEMKLSLIHISEPTRPY